MLGLSKFILLFLALFFGILGVYFICTVPIIGIYGIIGIVLAVICFMLSIWLHRKKQSIR